MLGALLTMPHILLSVPNAWLITLCCVAGPRVMHVTNTMLSLSLPLLPSHPHTLTHSLPLTSSPAQCNAGPRVMHVTNMMLEARDWVKQHFPYWDRKQGRDHIWLMSHDEGACYAPTDIYRESIFLTHWGRTDLVHE